MTNNHKSKTNKSVILTLLISFIVINIPYNIHNNNYVIRSNQKNYTTEYS